MAKAKNAKQKEFELVMNGTIDNSYEFTKKLKVTDPRDIEIIRKYKDNIAWSQIASRKTLTDDFINEFYEYLKPKFEKLCVNPNISLEFLKVNREYINWYDFILGSNGNRFTVEFLKEFDKEMYDYKDNILTRKGLPAESRRYLLMKDESNLNSIASNPKITMKTIKEYEDIIDWKLVSRNADCLRKTKNFEKCKSFKNKH